MSRTEPTNQEREQPLPRRRVHLMLQAKGGIGKTYVARVLAEYLNAPCYDLDSLNHTLSGYKEYLDVRQGHVVTTRIEAEDEHAQRDDRQGKPSVGAIHRPRMDAFLDGIVKSRAPEVVVDCGSPLYDPMMTYMVRTNLPTMLFDHLGMELWFHLIVCGGGSQKASVQDACAIAERWCTPEGKAVGVVWENEFQGAVVVNAGNAKTRRVGIQHLDAWLLLEPLIRPQLIRLRANTQEELDDIEQMVTSTSRTFKAVVEDQETSIFARSRIAQTWREYEVQLDALFVPDHVPEPAARKEATADVQVSDELAVAVSEARLADAAAPSGPVHGHDDGYEENDARFAAADGPSEFPSESTSGPPRRYHRDDTEGDALEDDGGDDVNEDEEGVDTDPSAEQTERWGTRAG